MGSRMSNTKKLYSLAVEQVVTDIAPQVEALMHATITAGEYAGVPECEARKIVVSAILALPALVADRTGKDLVINQALYDCIDFSVKRMVEVYGASGADFSDLTEGLKKLIPLEEVQALDA